MSDIKTARRVVLQLIKSLTAEAPFKMRTLSHSDFAKCASINCLLGYWNVLRSSLYLIHNR